MSTQSTFIHYWCDAHKRYIGHPYDMNWGKDNKIMGSVVSTYGASRTTQLIDEFFMALKTDEFLKRTGATIGVFKTQIPKLLMKIKPEPEDRASGRL